MDGISIVLGVVSFILSVIIFSAYKWRQNKK